MEHNSNFTSMCAGKLTANVSQEKNNSTKIISLLACLGDWRASVIQPQRAIV